MKEKAEKYDINDMQDEDQSLAITQKLIGLAILELNNKKEFINTYPSDNALLSDKNQSAYSEFLNQFSSDNVPLEEMLGILQEWIEHHQQGLSLIPPNPAHSTEDLSKIRVENTENIAQLIKFLNETLTEKPLLVELRDTLKNELGFGSSQGYTR